MNTPTIRTLAIDSSTPTLSIAILDGLHVRAHRQMWTERNHAVVLLPQIHLLLTERGLQPQDLHLLAVGQGPGSYTGVRIGITAAKTLAWALHLDIIAVSSLAAMAKGAYRKICDLHPSESLIHKTTWIVPMLDARRSQIYTGLYQFNHHGFHVLEHDRLCLKDQWFQTIAQASHSSQPDHLIWVSDTKIVMESGRTHTAEVIDVSQVKSLCSKQTKHHILTHTIDAVDTGQLAVRQYRRGERTDIHSLVPNYTQLPEAEVKRLAKNHERGQGPW